MSHLLWLVAGNRPLPHGIGPQGVHDLLVCGRPLVSHEDQVWGTVGHALYIWHAAHLLAARLLWCALCRLSVKRSCCSRPACDCFGLLTLELLVYRAVVFRQVGAISESQTTGTAAKGFLTGVNVDVYSNLPSVSEDLLTLRVWAFLAKHIPVLLVAMEEYARHNFVANWTHH